MSDDYADGCSIAQAGLSTKVANRLRRAGYSTVGKVRDATDEDLLDIHCIGPDRLNEVRTKLGPYRATTPQGAKQ